uniref:Uncharacterized protein n=1 Tax=Cercocebus atys TaxID=9531 RepID=A0A2K5MYK8_CERAT
MPVISATWEAECLTRPGSYSQIEKKLEPLSQDEDQHADLTQSRRPLTGCTIFLGYTSNLISSGIRETIRYLVQHNMVGTWWGRGLGLWVNGRCSY